MPNVLRVYSNAPSLVDVTIEFLSSLTRPTFLGKTSKANDDIRTFFRLEFTEIQDSPKAPSHDVTVERCKALAIVSHP